MNKDNLEKIGLMHGRFSPLTDGKFHAFPWHLWQAEVAIASALEIRLMEWVLDHDWLYENPLLMAEGRQTTKELSDWHLIKVTSLTGDLFSEPPFYIIDVSCT
jgi:hypothetical protein